MHIHKHILQKITINIMLCFAVKNEQSKCGIVSLLPLQSFWGIDSFQGQINSPLCFSISLHSFGINSEELFTFLDLPPMSGNRINFVTISICNTIYYNIFIKPYNHIVIYYDPNASFSSGAPINVILYLFFIYIHATDLSLHGVQRI